MKRRIFLKPLLLMGDLILLGGGFLISYHLRFALSMLPERPIPPYELYFKFSFLVSLIGVVMLYAFGMYRLQRLSFGIKDFFTIFQAITLSTLIVMSIGFALRGFITPYDLETFSRLIIGISWILDLVFVTCWRMSVSGIIYVFRKRGQGLRRLIIVGTDQVGRGFYKAVQQDIGFGYQPIGFVANGVPIIEDEIEGLAVLGEIENLPEILNSKNVDEVILACMNFETDVMAKLIKTCERADVQFSMIPGFFEILTHQMNVLEIADVPIFQLEEHIFKRWGRLVKRIMDIGLSIFVLALVAPVFAVLALVIKLESRGPILYRHARVGKGEKIFYMFKFRSMCEDAENRRNEVKSLDDSEDTLLRVSDDPRVTGIGKLLRRFSIDEFPQIINVLRGEMSWVGPRPHIPIEVAGYKEWHRRKYDVLPGITGLTQVSGRKNLSLDDMVRLDIYYIENWSPLLDMQILLKTLPCVLWGRGAY